MAFLDGFSGASTPAAELQVIQCYCEKPLTIAAHRDIGGQRMMDWFDERTGVDDAPGADREVLVFSDKAESIGRKK